MSGYGRRVYPVGARLGIDDLPTIHEGEELNNAAIDTGRMPYEDTDSNSSNAPDEDSSNTEMRRAIIQNIKKIYEDAGCAELWNEESEKVNSWPYKGLLLHYRLIAQEVVIMGAAMTASETSPVEVCTKLASLDAFSSQSGASSVAMSPTERQSEFLFGELAVDNDQANNNIPIEPQTYLSFALIGAVSCAILSDFI